MAASSQYLVQMLLVFPGQSLQTSNLASTSNCYYLVFSLKLLNWVGVFYVANSPKPKASTTLQLIQEFSIGALHQVYLSKTAVLLLYCHHHFFVFPSFSQTAKLKRT